MGYSIDGANKLISLTGGTTSFSVRDLWSRWIDWLLTSDNSKYNIAMDVVGGNGIDPVEGTFIPIYLFLKNGWKIKPQESNHTLKVGDGILLVEGGGDPFINTVGSFVVRINYQQPVQAISFSSTGGSGGLTTEQDTKLTELHQLQGLDTDNPMTMPLDKTARDAGSIHLDISDDGTIMTVQRS